MSMGKDTTEELKLRAPQQSDSATASVANCTNDRENYVYNTAYFT